MNFNGQNPIKRLLEKEILEIDDKDFFEQSPKRCRSFHSLCDIEILSHVFASKARKIVVYAGGGHCKRIANFLEKNGFRVLNHQHAPVGSFTEYSELPVSALEPLSHY